MEKSDAKKLKWRGYQKGTSRFAFFFLHPVNKLIIFQNCSGHAGGY